MEEEQSPRSHLRYWALIGGIILVVVVVLWWAMIKLNYKLSATRENFRPIIRTVIWMFIVGFVLLASIVVGINLIAKWGEKKKPTPPHEDVF
jgi:RsiW-degrading membrane proteinase PrsW (M82 family)